MSRKPKAESSATPALATETEAHSPITPDQPLVIDLPDGQKLVVGNMIAGSVIEVATWRGTGRPDSRTSRLMLGMSPGSISPTIVKTDKASGAESTPANRGAALLSALQSFPKNLFMKNDSGASSSESESDANRTSPSLSLKSDEPKSKKAYFFDFLIRSAHEQAVEVEKKQERDEIDEWLESIRAKSAASKKSAGQVKKRTATPTKAKKATTTKRATKGK